VQADAAQWVNEAAHQGSARLLFVDLYDHEAAAPVLDGEDFYAACRRCLDAQGVMAVNLFGRQASFALSLQRIEAAFGAAAVWHLQPTREGNTIVVATRQGPGAGIGSGLAPEVLAARADILHSRFGRHGLPVRKWKRMLRQG
jgi:spermidine synthase